MSVKQYQIKPIQLISFDNDKNLVLSQQAITLFKTFDAEQLHIITVAGKYRTGKSYILNRVLLNQNNGFQVGPTINACTKGLWMWPKIVEICDKNTNKIKKCVIIDTEGLGSLEQGQNTDMKIFLMAVLLSSYLIYNSVGSIDEKAIENLSLVINLAELLHKNQNQYDSQQLINSFPSFMWLVRDFSLRLQNQRGQPMTSHDYLQNALRYQNGTSQAVERKNTIRRKLKTFFQDRNCFTLIRPTQNQKDLQNLSSLHEKRLRPQFVRLINQFKQIINISLKPKKVRGKSVTPQGFIQVCKYFVGTINSGKIPSINSHWDNLCLKQASRIIQYYSSCHESKLKQYNNHEQNQKIQQKELKIEQLHKTIIQQAYIQIDKSFLGKLQKQLCKQKLQRMLTICYQKQMELLRAHHNRLIKSIVKQIFRQIMQQFEDNKLQSFQQIFSRFQQIKQKYKHNTSIYESFYQNSKDVFQQFLKNLKEFWQRQHNLLNIKNQYLQNILKQHSQQFKQKIQQSANTIRQLQQNNYKYQLKNKQLQQLILQLKQQCINLNIQNQHYKEIIQQLQQNTEINQQHQKQLQELKQEMEEQISIIQQQLHKKQIELAKMKQINKEISIKQRKIQRQMEIFKNKCSEYLKQNIELNQKLEKMNKKILEFGQNKRKQMIKQCKQNRKQLPEIIQNLSTTINQQQIKIKIKQEQNKNLISLLNSQKIAHQALLKAPQNINYSILKKNYQMEKYTNNNLLNKIKDYQLFNILFSYKCLICSSRVDKNTLKNHLNLCTSLKSINFDVSYQYNGNGQIQFIIDVYLDEQQWTIRKTIQNIKYFLKKMNIVKTQLFQQNKQNQNNNQQQISINQQRRLYLDQLFAIQRDNIWNSVFLIQYFGIDLNYLNFRNQKIKNNKSSMASSKVSIDLENIFEENMDNFGSNVLMKTGKFSKKTFNFGNI